MFGKTKKIHFIGIGGIGMSGMAELLNELGFSITGSDMENSERIHHLINKGIQIKIGHNKSNVSNCDVIVYSSAIKNDNIEDIKKLYYTKVLKLSISLLAQPIEPFTCLELLIFSSWSRANASF